MGHQARIRKIQDITLKTPGLFVTGNYLSGPSVGACVTNAQEAAQNISAYLRHRLNNTCTGKVQAAF